jgi:tetratricopeptide (TPR) repeat protein
VSEILRNRELQAAREATPSVRYPGRALTRAELAELVARHVWEHHGVEAPIDRKYLGRLERGEVRWPNARYRRALREILGVPTDLALGFHSANASRTAKELDPVNRRSFITAAALGGVSMAGRDRFFDTKESIDAAAAVGLDLRSSEVEELERTDAAEGGAQALSSAIALYDRITTRRNQGALSPRIDRALAELQGNVGAWAGWLAYDADDLPRAHMYLADTIVHARSADLRAVEVQALSYLILLLNRAGRYRDALQCTEQGLRLAAPGAPHKVRALLNMRAAASHAGLHDTRACHRSIAAAYRDFEGPAGDDEPVWVRFVTHSELDGLRGDAYEKLGDHRQAALVFRSIADHPDQRYRRNAVYYSARLASSLVEQGEIGEASARAAGVVGEARHLRSPRVVSLLCQVRDSVAPHGATNAEARQCLSAFREARIA